MTKIATIEALRALYGSPSVRAAQKQLPRLDAHAKAFLGRSPFVLIGSSSPGKLPDVSPKGGEPGFAAIIDDTHIAIPDRPGNKRLDTYENLLANPIVGLLFLLPGMDETLRVNGTAEIRTDDELLDRCAYEASARSACFSSRRRRCISTAPRPSCGRGCGMRTNRSIGQRCRPSGQC
ncbi:pyridoxamine 5'-phosphate oxidase family protein [Aurantimonas sp. E1-2-R+4]|uniref:pyridoxamine 5'-phosphate oxidase family protein n=1 Tax=Aurantimonas sp. E1-2-R+4 TaxID=3113714 RepID=UPI002F95AC0C